jgi:hypothetical protein
MRTIDIECITGRDLVAEFECDCPNERYKGSPIEHLMKHIIRLYGYNDTNFFDNVNKEPQTLTCKCGKEYRYQWTRDGVNVELV